MFIKLRSVFKFHKKREDKNKFNLQKLTPTKCEIMDFYKDTLDFIFEEDDLLNIGITGPYSAGKSSVIKTYEDLNRQKNFIYISLAYFKESEGDNETSSINETDLEGKIINQLIYQIDSNKISQTRFKVKTKICKSIIIINTIFISIFIILQVYLYKFKEWNTTINGIDFYKGNSIIETISNNMIEFLKFTTSSEFVLFSLLISTTIFIGYVYKLVRAQMEKPIFKKVKFQNNEIELFEKDKDEESYFDKYLDEIIYIFKNSHVDAIIFEDIDRYGDNLIFSKLREINYLINKKVHSRLRTKLKKFNIPFKEKSTRFFYLVKDDIFISKDRTKFFDFIMPIVPILDSSNSYDQMLKHFQEGRILDNFENSFLERLSLYIDDMRLLKNIYNEYIIYHGRIQCTELDCNKLLAIIVYKNIFPKDFSNLQLNAGFVYQIFLNKEQLMKKYTEDIDIQIKNNIDTIQKIENEHLNEIDELDTLYMQYGMENYRVEGKIDTDFDTRLEYIKALRRNKENVESYYNYSYYSGTNIEKLFDNLNTIDSYNERKAIIEKKMLYGINKFKNLNRELEMKKNSLDSLKLADFIKINKDKNEEVFTLNCLSTDSENKFIKFEEILTNKYYPLIKYLVRNRYIDETYFDYLTYFYANSLTRTDKIFLRSITDQIPKEYGYKLINVNQIISRLKSTDFEQEEILNFNLLSALLEQNHEYLSKFLNFLRIKKHFKFICAYMEQTSNLGLFIKELNKNWNTVWLDLLANKEISEDQKKLYMINTLYYSSIDEIEAMNENKFVTCYISSQDEFININEPETEIIIEKLIGLNVKFKNINYEKANKELFRAVYENNIYELNFYMIELILKTVYNYLDVEEFKEKNYTLISSKPVESLKDYVDRNINFYMEQIVNKIDGKFNDDENEVISILNNSNIEDEIKIKYISKLSTYVSDLSTVKENLEIWDELFRYNLIKYCINNILFYYFNKKSSEGELDNILVDYLNNNSHPLVYEYNDVKSKFEEFDISKFFNAVFIDKNLNKETYEKLLQNYKYPINEFDYKDISEDKIKILIKLKIIAITKFNIKFIREHYPHVCREFLCSDIDKYINCLDDELTNDDEILNLLDEIRLSDEHKFKLVKRVTKSISLVDTNYSETLIVFIMKNKFNIGELAYIIDKYEESSSVLKEAIQELSTLSITEIYRNNYILPSDLLHTLMINNEIDVEYRKDILYNNLDSLNFSQIKECLSSEDLNDFAAILQGKIRKILITDINKNLLQYFSNKKWISKFENDSKDSSCYRVVGTRSLKNKINL